MAKMFVRISCILLLSILLLATGASAQDWPMFGQSVDNAANNASETAVSQANVAALKPKWTDTVRSDVSARAAVVNQIAYVPDWANTIWALNTNTGAVVWRHFMTDFGFPSGTISRTSPAVADGMVFIGTRPGGTVLALDALTGALKWSTQIETHPNAQITGSPAVANGVLYIGVSSNEEGSARDPSYHCCSFRGSAVAIDDKTGVILWKTYMVPENYSGGAIWSSNPVVDTARGSVFFTTGNSYAQPSDPTYQACIAAGHTEAHCHPASDHYDSIVALDITTGAFKWWRRLASTDDWNNACLTFSAGVYNCPKGEGSDFDFAAGPNEITFTQSDGTQRTILGAGQKSGRYVALDPDTGQMIWARQVGPQAIQWGTATDGRRIYVAISNDKGKTYFGGTGGGWSALDPATGAVLWRRRDPNGAKDLGPLAVANGVVYAPSMATGTTQPTMFALSADTGKVLWSFASGASVVAGATVAEGKIFWGSGYRGAGTGNNKFYAFSIDGQ